MLCRSSKLPVGAASFGAVNASRPHAAAGGKTGYSEVPASVFVVGENNFYATLSDFVEAYQRHGRLREAVTRQ